MARRLNQRCIGDWAPACANRWLGGPPGCPPGSVLPGSSWTQTAGTWSPGPWGRSWLRGQGGGRQGRGSGGCGCRGTRQQVPKHMPMPGRQGVRPQQNGTANVRHKSAGMTHGKACAPTPPSSQASVSASRFVCSKASPSAARCRIAAPAAAVDWNSLTQPALSASGAASAWA